MGETIFAIPGRAPTDNEVQRDAHIGGNPGGPGFGLVWGSLAAAKPEAVADAVLGYGLDARAEEPLALERFRYVSGLSALDRATLGAAVENFKATGLVRVVVGEDGKRYWQRASLKARPRRDLNRAPDPVTVAPIEVNDAASRKLREAEIRGLSDAIDRRLRAHGLIA